MSIAIITGASSGLGKCYIDAVIKLYPNIDELWLIARRLDRLNEIKEMYPNKHFLCIPLDLSLKDNFKILEEKLEEKRPQIEVLINDAAVSISGMFKDSNFSQIIKMIDLNCIGTTIITKLCLPYILKKGTIVEVASTSAFVPNTNLIVYSSTKSYLKDFSLGLREELKEYNINVCAVCPGFMLTEMTKENPTKKQKRLPVVNPKKAALKSLKAAKRGRAVYTTGLFYKIYRLCAKILPHTLLIKFAHLE